MGPNAVELPLATDGRPFDLPAQNAQGRSLGVLCIHGFTGTPFEVAPLGMALSQRGFTCVGPLLPGHGADASALNRTTWHDWVGRVEDELDALRERCRKVALVGLSMGGLCALHIAAKRPRDVAAVGALAVPLWLPTWVERVLPQLQPWIARAPWVLGSVAKRGGSDVLDPDAKRLNPSLRDFPLLGLGSLQGFCRETRAMLPQVVAPTFIAHSRQDHTAPFACALELRDRVGAAHVELLKLERSYHLLPVDVERDLLARRLGDFLDESM